MTGLQRFNKVVDDYKRYYQEYNDKEVINVEYVNGFVYLTTLLGGLKSTNKYRIW